MAEWPSAEAINKRIEMSNAANGRSSKLTGLGSDFISLGTLYGINPGIVAAMLQKESQLGADGSELPTNFNNFGGNTAGSNGSVPGDCGARFFNDRYWKIFCSPRGGLEGVFQNLNSSLYRDTGGIMSAILEVYAPASENDHASYFETLTSAGADMGIAIGPGSNLYRKGKDDGDPLPSKANPDAKSSGSFLDKLNPLNALGNAIETYVIRGMVVLLGLTLFIIGTLSVLNIDAKSFIPAGKAVTILSKAAGE